MSWDLSPTHNDTSIPDPAKPFHLKLLDALASCCAPGDSQSWCIDAVTPAFCTLHGLVNAADQDDDANTLVKVSQQLASGAHELFTKFEEGYSEKADVLMSECKVSCSEEKIRSLKDNSQRMLYQ